MDRYITRSQLCIFFSCVIHRYLALQYKTLKLAPSNLERPNHMPME